MRRKRRGGRAIAEICMGGLGQVRIGAAASNSARDEWPTFVEISSAQPVLACLASQYAGWSLSASKEETGGKKFFALGSGPARSSRARSRSTRNCAIATRRVRVASCSKWTARRPPS